MNTTSLVSWWIAAAVLVGCGGGGGGTASDGTTTGPSGTTTSPSGTTDGGSTDGGPTGTGTGSPTTSTEETTSPPVTATSVDPVTSTSTVGESTVGETAGESTAGESTAGESTAGTTGDPGGVCEGDKDCTLLSDCCRCEAIAVGDEIPECPDIQCLQSMCDALQIDSVSCRFGTCVTEKLHCDGSAIVCDQAPPVCETGFLPQVNDSNTCWTGACVPIAVCDVVPDCGTCPKEQMCVIDETMFGPKHRCEPIPPDCVGQPTCGCAAQACDNLPYDTCAEQPAGLHCSCPNC